MPETRRMHYVPRSYLKNFAVAKGNEYYVHALNKTTNAVIELNIKNVCVETDLYKIESDNPAMRQLVENMYGKVFEEKYEELYNLLTDENIVSITTEQRLTAIQFVISMFYRHNMWLNGQNRLWDETLEKVYWLAKTNGKESFMMGDTEVSIAGKTLEELKMENRIENRTASALISMQTIFRLSRARLERDVICLIKVKRPLELVTSDQPVRVEHKEKGHIIPIDPDNTFSIPINPEYILQLRPWSHELDVNNIGRMEEGGLMAGVYSSMNNAFQGEAASRFVLGTKYAVESYQKKPMGIFQDQKQ